ncbi:MULTISPECIES: restriction endonuclease subunit S [Streptococcus]|uniref:Type I restriction modification DNA specificity domain protein n=2 Tax=Streptococcus mitis TaxID=28037 RepID=E1LPS7_STRMT|nr:restriction endonuclease subunit S [Streptococcus mitis]EFN97720.1 type I restriction modification DNA specificity domain protein [Streptococcus mitis SK564]
MKNHKEQFPIIRFHTYRDEWKQHKLGEVFEQTVEYVDPYEQNLELWSVTVESGLTPKEERYNREFLVKKSDKFKKLYPEEIVYNPMNITIGAVGFNNAGKKVAVSGYYVTMKMKSKFSNKFFSAWLSCPKAIRLYKIYSTGSLIERQRVQFPTLSDIKDYFPTFDEQSAIGSLFRTLDDLLSSYKDNLTNYQALKATMLSKMFPKAGQTVPEIRLNGFEEDWERKSLSEVCTINSGRDYKHLKNGDIPVYGTGGYMLSVNEKLSDEDAIGIGRKGTIDKPYLLSAPFWTVDTLFYVICKVGYDLNYLFLIFQKIRWKKFDESTGVPSLSKKTIEKVVSKFPSYEEQCAIGLYFSDLDNLINYYQEKISQLETLKKKLLQDMFI